MNILKKDLAPITERAWEEIESQTKRVLGVYQTSRKIADIHGPAGLDLGGISTGRLRVPPKQAKSGVSIGIREVIPLVEVRKSFALNRWELDNASRNLEDLDLGALEKAAQQMAAFEDRCLYYGMSDSLAPGLFNEKEDKAVEVGLKISEFLHVVAEQVVSLQRDAVEGPYALVLPTWVWVKLSSESTAYPIRSLLKEVIGGDVLTHHYNEDIFLVSERGGDIELHLGQDISLGYETHDKNTVELFFTESFVFQIHGREAIRTLKPKK